MQLNIEKHNFCELNNILGIKNHLEKLNNVKINNAKAKGDVEVNVAYTDLDGSECFKLISLPFEVDLDELKIIDIVLGKTNVFVVEAQGLNIEYELVINYLLKNEEQAVEIEVIDEPNINYIKEEIVEENNCNQQTIEPQKEEHEEDLDKIKDETLKYYEDKLKDSLKKEEDSIIVTKSREDEKSFLSFFDDKLSYYKIKCLYIENESCLNDISKEYNIPLEKLLSGYDKESNKVIFKIK